MIVFLLNVALALEPPARPEALEASGEECANAVSLELGATAPCIGVLLGPADVRWYLSVEDHYEHLRGLYRVDTASLEHERERVSFERDWYAAELERQREPVPILQRPGTHVSVGVIVSLALTLTAAYGLRAVGEGDHE